MQASDGQDEAAQSSKIRILLADDHTVMRAGTRRILEDEPDFVIVGEAGDGYETLELVEDAAPDVVVLDISMPKLDGIKTSQALRQDWPGVRILMLTGHDNGALVRTLYALGVEGYLLKSASAPELVGAIRAVHAGAEAYSDDASRALSRPVPTEMTRPSQRELQVLTEVARGRKNREVAAVLHVSENTVEFHLRNLYAKLHASSRADALMRAQRLGWLDNFDPLC
jgi:DNA-binding NarL/FixJ family response regulator